MDYAVFTEEMKKDLREAFKINALQTNACAPVDWTYNNTPALWEIDGKTEEFDFIENSYPALLDTNTQPY